MSSLNKVQLIGNLGADPDIRHTQAGDPIVNLRMATTEKWKDKSSGEMRERTEWHSVSLFGGLAKVAEKYLSKGDKVYIEGQLQTREYEKDGVKRYATSVNCSGFGGKLIMLGGGAGGSSAGPREEPKSLGQQLDDEIPF